MARRRSRSKGSRSQKTKTKQLIPPSKSSGNRTKSTAVVWLAFLLSVLAGLMHQVIWAKLLVQLIGATAHAQAIVLAVFMGGLAIGAELIGRCVDRIGQPVRIYVWLEFGIAAYCLVLPLFVKMAGYGYVALAAQFFDSTGAKLGLRLALASIVVLPPAVLMGGTLPALARHLIVVVDETRGKVANLYALNSFGAALGAGVAGFATLPLFGVYGSLVAASLLNIMAGGLLLGTARRESAAQKNLPAGVADKSARPHVAIEPYRPHQYAVALMALALSGFAAMAYEVLFTRVIALAFGATIHSFSVMLISFITGIALGSAIAARVPVRNPLWLFGVAQFAVVVTLVAATPLVSRLPYLTDPLRIALRESASGYVLYQAGKALLCLGVLLVPTICLGFGFPLVTQIEVRNPQRVAGTIGSTYAWNTVGNVLGAIGTSLVLLPALGLLNAFHLSLSLNLIAALTLLLVSEKISIVRRFSMAVATAACLAVYLAFGGGWLNTINFAPNHLYLRSGPKASQGAAMQARHPASSFEAWQRHFVVDPDRKQVSFFGEDAQTTVMVTESAGHRILYVNGKPDASTTPEDLETQIMVAQAPLFLALDARSVMLLGHGSGITLGSILSHPVEHVDLVEISPSVLEADAAFAEHNNHALEDARVHVYQEDGRSFLRTTPRRYDVIISEPSNPWMVGVSELFTVEFFRNARDRLEPGGIFTAWFHTYFQTRDTISLVLRTLADVFPHTLMFSDNDAGNLIVLGSLRPLRPEFAGMEARFKRPQVYAELARLRMPNLAALLTHHRFSEARYRSLLGDGSLNTAMRQRLEYDSVRGLFHGKSSYFVERRDPLILSYRPPVDILLDQYIDWRRSQARPVSPDELNRAARYAKSLGGYGDNVYVALASRAILASGPPVSSPP